MTTVTAFVGIVIAIERDGQRAIITAPLLPLLPLLSAYRQAVAAIAGVEAAVGRVVTGMRTAAAILSIGFCATRLAFGG